MPTDASPVHESNCIGEVSGPTEYLTEASSINLLRSAKYGFGGLAITLKMRLQKLGLARFRLFSSSRRKLMPYYHVQELNAAVTVDLMTRQSRRNGQG